MKEELSRATSGKALLLSYRGRFPPLGKLFNYLPRLLYILYSYETFANRDSTDKIRM